MIHICGAECFLDAKGKGLCERTNQVTLLHLFQNDTPHSTLNNSAFMLSILIGLTWPDWTDLLQNVLRYKDGTAHPTIRAIFTPCAKESAAFFNKVQKLVKESKVG
jgi:hypothetical protein